MNPIRNLHTKITVILLILVLLTAGCVPASLAGTGPADALARAWTRMHPSLTQLAAQYPAQSVRVIVQHAGETATLREAIAQLGGTVDRELSIINSLVVLLPAGRLDGLAALPSVRWISPDAGMLESSGDSQLVYTTWAGNTGHVGEAVTKDFKNAAVPAGSTLWFTVLLKTKNLPASDATVQLENVVIEFDADGSTYRVELPDSTVQYKVGNNYASTYYDSLENRWTTTVPARFDKELFATGVGFPLDTALPGGVKAVRGWARVVSTTPGIEVEWQWAAAAYRNFSGEPNDLAVKAVHKTDVNSAFPNDRPAGTPENFRGSLISGGTGDGGSNFTGDYSSSQRLVPGFANAVEMARAIGPDGVFAEGKANVDAVTGFQGEFTPGFVVSKVEVLFDGYANKALGNDIKANLALPGWDKNFDLKKESFAPVVGVVGQVAVDVTSLRTWHWTDFANGLRLRLDQTGLSNGESVFYDGVGLRVTSIPGTADQAVKLPTVKPGKPVKLSNLSNAFPYAVRATEVWNQAPAYLQGQGVTIAIVDSGIGKSKSLSRNFLDVNFSREYRDGTDKYGHGTFVAMLAAGDGNGNGQRFMGTAPGANLLNVRVTNDQGQATEATVIEALQWILINKDVFKIRVINLSLNSSVAQSYHTSPLNAAVEILWFNGIVVVVSAGNNGTSTLYPPANDPFVITVGATDDLGTPGRNDDTMASFSAYGVDETGQVKPDIVAPGRNIITYVPSNDKMTMGTEHPENRRGKTEYRMSGTSMAAPIVTGAIAILLQDEPGLNPDQVKARLKATASKSWAGYDPVRSGAGYLDIYAAVHSASQDSANQGLLASQLLWTGTDAVTWTTGLTWSSVNWNSVNWNSVNWNSVNWNSVNWNSVNWNSDFWGDVVAASNDVPLDITAKPAIFMPMISND